MKYLISTISDVTTEEENGDWEKLSYAEKNWQLYFRQKQLIDTFLEHHAISKEQFDKSLEDLTVKMGMENTAPDENSKGP